MKTTIPLLFLICSLRMSAGDGYKVGDNASDFTLKNVDGKYISMADFPGAKGFVVVFTCNHCPFAKAYQDRIIDINKEYKVLGYPVIAINPNDSELSPDDSYEAMILRAKEKNYTFPYLIDEKQEVYKMYGATRTPEVYLLQKTMQGGLIVKYSGTIDDNYQDASAVKDKYLVNALNAVIAGNEPNPDHTKSIGCSIKDKTTQK